MEIRPVGAELLHADGRMDMTVLRVTSRNFAKAPKNNVLCASIQNQANGLIILPSKFEHRKMACQDYTSSHKSIRYTLFITTVPQRCR
jgi:hypothetical protein